MSVRQMSIIYSSQWAKERRCFMTIAF